MANLKYRQTPEIVRTLWVQALLGALIGFGFGLLLLTFNVANMRDLFANSDVKLLASFLYFSSLMSTFSLALVSSAALGLDETS